MVLKLLFTVSLFDAQPNRDSVENKPASLPVVPLEKVLNGIFHLKMVGRLPATPN